MGSGAVEHVLPIRATQLEQESMSRERREFLALVDAHGSTLVAMLPPPCRNSHDAEDVFQETAVRVWQTFENRPKLWNPRGWLIKIAFRAFLDYQERSNRTQQDKTQAPLIELADIHSPSPESLAERSEWCQRLSVAIEGCRPTFAKL